MKKTKNYLEKWRKEQQKRDLNAELDDGFVKVLQEPGFRYDTGNFTHEEKAVSQELLKGIRRNKN